MGQNQPVETDLPPPFQYVYKPKGSTIWWWRPGVPERLRPVLPKIDGFEDIPNRINLKVSLCTEDVGIANAKVLDIQRRVDVAFEHAEKLLDGTKSLRVPTPLRLSRPPPSTS